jgi:hypothetical protein
MGSLIRWMVEFWIMRFIFRWLWRAMVLATLVIGVAVLGGQGDNLKQFFFGSPDKSGDSPGATQATVERAQSLEQPAVTMIKAGWQRDQQAIQSAAQVAKPMIQRVSQQVYEPLGKAGGDQDTWKNGAQQDDDHLNQQLESLRNRRDSSSVDSNGGQ